MIENCNFRIYGNIINAELVERNGFMIGNRSFLFTKREKIALYELKKILERF